MNRGHVLIVIEQLEGTVYELAEFMSELSEQAYSATWMDGLEYALWYALENGPMEYGRLSIRDDNLAKLKVLSDAVGGWVYFDDEIEETFVEIGAWIEKYQQNIEDHRNKLR